MTHQDQEEEKKYTGFVSPLQKARAGKIGGGRSTPEPERQAPPPPEPQSSTQPEKKLTQRDTHFRQTVWMPKTLNRRLKVQAAKEEKDVSGIINELVEAYLRKVED